MRRSTDKILTTHVGALPGPADTWSGENVSDDQLKTAVKDVVAQQRKAGVDIVNEGELTKGGNWVTFINSRLSGFEAAQTSGGTFQLLRSSRDWVEFEDFYAKALAGGTLFEQTATAPVQTSRIVDWRCTAPIRYTGQLSLKREIAMLRDALGKAPVGDSFLTTTAPASVEVGRKNEHYKSEKDFLYGLADGLKEEYEGIAASGMLVQVDDAWLPALWDRIGISMGLEAFQRRCRVRVEALNHACVASPRTGSATPSAGEAGTVRMPTIWN